MVRREIKHFEIITEGGSYQAQTPFSVNSVLSAAGANVKKIGSTVSFNAEIYVDDVALAMKNMYLRVRDLRLPARIYFCDKLVCETDGVTPVYNIDIAGLASKGNNPISIRFDAESVGDLTYAGLSQPLEILRFGGAIIDRVFLTRDHGESGVTLGIKLGLIGNPDGVRAVATLVSSAGQIYYAGLTRGQGSIHISDPLYWWPKGLGVQNLYRLTVNLYGETDIEDSAEMRIGLRTVDTVEGSSALTVNDCPFLPMGATYIAEADPDRAAADRRAEAFVTSASMANYNCLVIPENSPTPSERFFELCDIHGIMVIEEHRALDEAALLSLERRAHHASLCLIDLIGSDKAKAEKAAAIERLPSLALSVLGASPKYVSAPSLPSMKTIRTAVPETERNLFSKSVEDITPPDAMREMLLSVADRYPYPSDLSGFAYASALASVGRVSDVIRGSRLGMGKNGRAVFDRLGDPNMTVSGSAIDYKGRWKPLQYYSARHFAPVRLYAEANGASVVFSVSNLRRLDFIGSLEYRIADASNYTIYKSSEPCEVAAMTAERLSSRGFWDYVRGHEHEYYLEYYLKEGSTVVSKGTLLFVPEKHFAFKKPRIKSVVTGQDRRFSVTLSADCFVKDLEIGFDGVDAVFEDNYIDFTSEAPVKVSFTVTGGMETSYHLKDALELRSVYDLK
nr:hypothetical protein [Oscillospiraceae bacterium]